MTKVTRAYQHVSSYFSLLFNPHMILLVILGISSGLPLALTSTTLQAWFAVDNIGAITIGFIGLVGQPYAFKFLWSPFLDRYTLPLLSTRRRSWMFFTQLVLLLTISAMAWLTPHANTNLLIGLAFFTAIFSATQDIAIDAYRTELLKPEERGIGSAFFVCGYRIGMLLSGAIALILADNIGWRSTYLIMASFLLISMVCTWLSPEGDQNAPVPVSLTQAVIKPLIEFMQRESSMAILLFILLFKLGDALINNLSSLFLLRDLGFSLTAVGTVNKGVGLIASLVGAFAGGIILIRQNLIKSLFLFGILQSLSILGYLALALIGKNLWFMTLVIGFESFCVGLNATAFVTFFMTLCNHQYTATQFALLTAIAAIGRVGIGPVFAALLLKYFTWPMIFCIVFLASLPCLLLLWRLRKAL